MWLELILQLAAENAARVGLVERPLEGQSDLHRAVVAGGSPFSGVRVSGIADAMKDLLF